MRVHPLANIFDCMKGHNRKLNRLRGRASAMAAAALSRCKTGFFLFSPPPCKRIGVGEGGGGASGVGMQGLALTREAAPLQCHCSMVPTLFFSFFFTQHSTVHNRPRN